MRDAVVFSAHTGDFLFRLWVFLLVLCFVFFFQRETETWRLATGSSLVLRSGSRCRLWLNSRALVL
jgi:hypothetical protein